MSDITPQLRAMLSDRARLETERKKAALGLRRWRRLVDTTFAMLERAAPFIDEQWNGSGWKPSEKLALLYYTCASCDRQPEASKEALLFIQDMIERGRRLWIEGLNPDPWQNEPKIPLSLRTYGAEVARQNGAAQ